MRWTEVELCAIDKAVEEQLEIFIVIGKYLKTFSLIALKKVEKMKKVRDKKSNKF